MHSGAARDKILKSWAGVPEVTLIKEVATKGEHIQLCIEYWAKKRKLPKAEYELFFHDVVQTYVQRLLSERLVCKAEMVLRNVQRDVQCFYFQFACECEDAELQEMVLEHLHRKRALTAAPDWAELQYNWELLKQVQGCPATLAKCKIELRRNINLEALVKCEPAFRKRLEVELYFSKRRPELLQRLDKTVLWHYLVETQQMPQIVRWCYLSNAGEEDEDSCSELELKYMQWPLEAEMYEHALRALHGPVEVVRNCFAAAGHFFADERDDVPRVLRRICCTESFERNRELLEKLPIGRFLLKRGYYALMLRDFVSSRELEELCEESTEHNALLKLLLALKENNLQERDGFEQIAAATRSYLELQEVDFQSTQPLATLYDFLCNEPTVAALNCFLLSSSLKFVPYLRAMSQRLESGSSGVPNLPTPYDFLRKFKHIDLKDICKERQEQLASFSNERLCQKYARKYQLNFLHYLKQQRSAFAVYYLLTEQLQHYAQLTKAQLFSASESVTELALQHASNTPLITHCVAFIEMLGFDTQQLRRYLKLCRLLSAATELLRPQSFVDLALQVERVLLQRLAAQEHDFPLADYQALLQLVTSGHRQQQQQQQWPQLILQHYAGQNDWWRLLVLLQYFDVPLIQVQQLLDYFEARTMGEHFLRAISYELPNVGERGSHKWRPSASRQQSTTTRPTEKNLLTTSMETMHSSLSSCNDQHLLLKSSSCTQSQQLLRFLSDCGNGTPDLFAIVLISSSGSQINNSEEHLSSGAKFLELLQQDNHQPSNTAGNLLKNCVKFRLPVLAILSATVSAANIPWKWAVWLAVSTDQWHEVLRLAVKDAQELCWTLLENCVRLGYTSTLHRSFYIFQQDNPFSHFFHFLHRTQQQSDFSDESVHELRLFLLAWSNDELKLPLCKSQPKREQLMQRCIKLLLVHLQQNFESTIEQQRFLGCICRSDMGDISGGWLDFCLLHRVFNVLQTMPGGSWPQRFPINFEALLQRNNKVYEQLLAALLEAKQYSVAVQLASLLQLPICDIVYSKWVAGVEQQQPQLDEQQQLEFEKYEQEIAEHSLPPELLVNFYLYAAARLTEPSSRKYLLLKRALNVIKRHHLFPNECFDRDQIEYDMILCYLQVSETAAAELEIYHSEYYEQIMLRERCVLYKSFLELKELAGIDDLNVSLQTALTPEMLQRLEALLHRLLDEGDIVEALRLQELFECRPIDLRFVVFCMALAEGVTTIFSMSSEERQMLRDIEKSSFARFNRRTLGTLRSSGSQPGRASPLKGSNSNNNEFSDSCSTLEFEEIPSKEKRETLDTIQGIASKLKYGVEVGRRVVMAYRAAMYLDKEYMDVLRTKDVSVLLKSVSEDGGCLHRLLVVSDILTSTRMSAQEIAELLAYELTRAVLRPRFYIFSADQQARHAFKSADLWGYNIDRELHLFLELTPSTTQLGNCLLEYCDALKAYRKFQDNKPFVRNAVFEQLAELITRYGLPASPSATSSSAAAPAAAPSSTASSQPPLQVLSHKKQNLIYVELLIKAHECFLHECCMEGMAQVLHRAKSLNAALTKAKSWSLIVRLLIGLARYREMFYCFDALIEHEQFESLLGQFDEEKTIGLRQAILAYLREYHPEDGKEYLKLAALHFLMYTDLAEMWQHDATALLTNILTMAQVDAAHLPEQISISSLTNPTADAKAYIPKLRSNTSVLTLLQQALENYTHATENYLLDSKLLLAQKSASKAEMVAVQLDLASKALERAGVSQTPLCVCVINVKTRSEFRELVNSELSVPQAMILSRAYDYDINWTEALLSQYIILKKRNYLTEYLAHLPINDAIIDNIVKGFQLYAQRHKPAPQMEEHLAALLELIKSVTLKYKLASLLARKSTVMALLNEQTLYYLRDTNYGRNETHQNMSDI